MQPLAFFWDIENCQVPVSKPAFAVVQRLRERFGDNYAEVEFIVVCDVTKERPDVVEDLNAAQITVIHVKSLAKNACDDKLRTSMTKFSMLFKAPAVVVLISSDVNFAPTLTDLRYRCGFRIMLLHNENVSNTLLRTANECYDWQNDILAFIPDRHISSAPSSSSKMHKVFVYNLPSMDEYRIRDRLKQLSDNCGGRVLQVDLAAKTGVIGFVTPESAMRAQKRIDSADVFGKRISVRLVGGGGGRLSTSSNATATAPQLHHSSTAPSSFTYIGQSAIRHHFPLPPPGESVGATAVDRASERQKQDSGSSENAENVDAVETADNPTAAENDMKSTRDHCIETERLKRVLGFASHERTITFSTTEDDEGLDFTPVKMTDENDSDEPARAERHARHSSTSLQPGLFGEKPNHSSPSKLRLLERFAREAAELLRGSPQCRILLQRFASSWCNYFNRPLRLAEFGCAKLSDLLGEVSDTLQIMERPHKEKWVTLTPALLKSSLQDQIVSILRQQPFRRAPVDRLMELYQLTFGYALNLRLFGFSSIDDVLSNMRDVVEVETTDNGIRVINLVDFRHRQMLANQLLYMFIRCPERRLASWQLGNEFRAEFGVDVSLEDVKNYLSDLVQITEYDAETIFIELNAIQRLALRLRRILVLNGGELPLSELEQIYSKHYGERIVLADGTSANKSVLGVLRSASHVLYLKGRGAANCTVCINRNFLSSLKDLKPDLFIPHEVMKVKKRGNGHSTRSLSFSGNGMFDKMPSYGGNEANTAVTGGQGDPTQVETIPAAPPASRATRIAEGEKPAFLASVDNNNISAASTPLDSNGFDKEKRSQAPCSSRVNVLIAGSGSLPLSPTKFSSPSLPVRAPRVKNLLESMAKSESTSPVMPSSCRRSRRLAVNFEALPKN